jgi:hypothetical protein
MLAIASIAALLSLSRRAWGLFIQTWYVPGYDGGRFHTLSRGMSADDVEAIAGPPAVKTPWGPDTENWQYSGRAVSGALYHRRWVVVTKGKVSEVFSDIFGY